MSVFAENLRWTRKNRRVTQAELAAKIRVHRRRTTSSYICRLEKGQIDPRLSTVYSLARALRVPAWYLIADVLEAPEFWDRYFYLRPAQKREVQRIIKRMIEREEVQ